MMSASRARYCRSGWPGAAALRLKGATRAFTRDSFREFHGEFAPQNVAVRANKHPSWRVPVDASRTAPALSTSRRHRPGAMLAVLLHHHADDRSGKQSADAEDQHQDDETPDK